MIRFKRLKRPSDGINQYLKTVYDESVKRGYSFDKRKIRRITRAVRINVPRGQLQYETAHLLKKLRARDRKQYDKLAKKRTLDVHPLFIVKQGAVEEWEVIGLRTEKN